MFIFPRNKDRSWSTVIADTGNVLGILEKAVVFTAVFAVFLTPVSVSKKLSELGINQIGPVNSDVILKNYYASQDALLKVKKVNANLPTSSTLVTERDVKNILASLSKASQRKEIQPKELQIIRESLKIQSNVKAISASSTEASSALTRSINSNTFLAEEAVKTNLPTDASGKWGIVFDGFNDINSAKRAIQRAPEFGPAPAKIYHCFGQYQCVLITASEPSADILLISVADKVSYAYKVNITKWLKAGNGAEENI